MIQVIEAIYSNGVFKPITPVNLQKNQRVKLTIVPITEDCSSEQEKAIREILADAEQSSLYLDGPLPTRDELHDRRP